MEADNNNEMNMQDQGGQMGTVSFGAGFTYPFRRFLGLFNILWIIVPFVGFFALVGYRQVIVRSFVRGEFKQLPALHFWDNAKNGFFLFFKMIPFMIVWLICVSIITIVTDLFLPDFLAGLFVALFTFIVVPVLSTNFLCKGTVGSFFELRLLKHVFAHFGDYAWCVVKSIVLGFVFLLMLVLVLIGLPALLLGNSIFMADFYRRRVLSSA